MALPATSIARELEPNGKLFPNHFPFILHGAQMVAGSLWPTDRTSGLFRPSESSNLTLSHLPGKCTNKVHSYE
jgi:hypothetical protein